MRIHIHLTFGLSPKATAKAFEEGNTPDRVAYGFHHAEAFFKDVTYSSDMNEFWLLSKFRSALNKILKFDIVHAFRNREKILNSDVVWTMRETEYIAVILILNIFQRRRVTKTICQNIWMFDDIKPRDPIWRFRLSIAKGGDVQLTHSNAYLEAMRRWMPKSDIRLNYFGISKDTFSVAELKTTVPHARGAAGQRLVVAAGNDKTRDWETLVDALGSVPGVQLKIACRWISEQLTADHQNIQVLRSLSFDDLKKLYEKADFIVVPMVENNFSGITVALEAAALGRPLICTRTGGVPTYFSEKEAIFVEPRRADQIREAVVGTDPASAGDYAAQAKARFRSSGYTSFDMVGRYAAISQEFAAEHLKPQVRRL